jgi:hypothetical protein
MLPLLIFPFLTGIFWALGGGTGDQAHAQTAGVAQGLNMSLPSPHFDKNATVLDKLGFYKKAALDSARKAEQGKSLPYLPVQQTAGYSKGLTAPTSPFAAGAAGTPYTARPATGYTDPNVEKVNETGSAKENHQSASFFPAWAYARDRRFSLRLLRFAGIAFFCRYGQARKTH